MATNIVQLSEGSGADAGLASLAALPTVADRLAYSTAADTWAETALTAAGRAILDDADAAAQLVTLGLADIHVRATIAVADSAAGATDVLLTVDCFRLDGTTRIASARQIMILAQSAQYSPINADTSPTFGTATAGTIVASGGGWCLAETDATGNFDCTVTNATDETLYFSVTHPHSGQGDASKGCHVWSNSDAATWSA